MLNKALGTRISCQIDQEEIVIGRLRAISEIKAECEMVDVTCLDATGGWRQYMPGLKDMGEVTLEGFYENEQAGQAALRALYRSSSPAVFTVTFPDSCGVRFCAYVKSYAIGAAQVEGALGFTAVLRMTGEVTPL